MDNFLNHWRDMDFPLCGSEAIRREISGKIELLVEFTESTPIFIFISSCLFIFKIPKETRLNYIKRFTMLHQLNFTPNTDYVWSENPDTSI